MSISSQAKQVFSIIKNGKRSGNQVVISYQEIADLSGLQITMVSSCIRMLVNQEFIERHNNFNAIGGAKKNSYKILRIPEGL
ncbi:hypothetical protein [Escherichia coli]|uniref:hypothetical protein n=1 Tax=Escherichia coli TaxID=562 RepID=UPI000A37D185|nr:hypothetical protein [Escherichia coli]EAC2052504.1 hypothetical protein [Escherichia coli]EFJ3254657.1 hypothetical protein [Escherichia coli]EGI4544360.1 hypothetical protein [Escherichia coli]EIE9183109.1 hypothetical protein [Escherichia coli]EIM9269979.1 hypothetical protein [Escherichia coli]